MWSGSKHGRQVVVPRMYTLLVATLFLYAQSREC
jgi:hypothetical protein